MNSFFSMENPFFSGLYKVMECILLNMLWLVFCIPLITAGASTSAMYYTVQKCLKNDRGYVISCFWHSFRENFKTGTGLSVMFLAAVFIWITDLSLINYLQLQQIIPDFGASIFFGSLLILTGLYGFWVFTLLARFRCSWKQTLRNALILGIRHWSVSLIAILLLALTGLVIYIIPATLFLMPVICIWLISVPLEGIFRLYMANSDKHLEDEHNLYWQNDYTEESID